jgi:hypothetical protein
MLSAGKEKLKNKCVTTYRDADKSLAQPGRKKLK